MNRAIEWFASNKVAANLLMLVLIVGGLVTLPGIRQEVFPEFDTDQITVTVPYPGAAPEEVEEAVCVRIEEQIQGITGIKKMTSTAKEGQGVVTVELLEGQDAREVLDEVKARVDAIDTFPEETESPVIQELLIRRQVISVSVAGQADERTLRVIGEQVRDELAALPEITQVELTSVRPYEVSVEVSEQALRRYGLTFDEVADAVRRSSLDLPGGSIKTRAGEILLRTKGQSYRGGDFERITLISRRDGTQIRLSDIATVVDGFADTDQASRFDGRPSVVVNVFRVGDQSALDIAAVVKSYLAKLERQLPDGIRLTTYQDDTVTLRGRIDLLVRNGRAGLVLVVLILALFLRGRLAFWVSLGIPISFLGTFWLLPSLGVSINLVSLFAFVVVLGIVVDDAIVVGESIYSHHERGKPGLRAAVDGAREVSVPITFAVLTSIAAFVPLAMVPGRFGKIFWVLPAIVIPTLLFSLIESQFVLPAHLSGLRPHGLRPPGRWGRLRQGLDDLFNGFVERVYLPSLQFALDWRYLTAATTLVTLIVTAGLVAGGWIDFAFLPDVEADAIGASLIMPLGTPVEATRDGVARLDAALEQLRAELAQEGHEDALRHVITSVGQQPYKTAQSQAILRVAPDFSGSHLGEVAVELSPAQNRTVSSTELAQRWRVLTGAIPDAVELTFSSSIFSAGDPVDVQLTGSNFEELQAAADELKTRLGTYPGVMDITDTFRQGKQEVKLRIRPQAEVLGLSQLALARQVRQAFYGEEAQRIQRGRDEVKVMVRYPASERRSLGNLEEMRVRTPGGREVPFGVVASAELGRGYSEIRRVDRNRAVNVRAKVDLTQANPNEIIASLERRDLPVMLASHPGVAYTLEGEQREQNETLDALMVGFSMALFIIFALLAVPLRSYSQPLVIMSAIPFGLVGAVWGHVLLGQQLTIMSMFGVVALAGVVVNDSLVLVNGVNRFRRAGLSLQPALREGGRTRFRPILLTSLTTFGGLTPLLLEESLQAQFMIPMAISLAFGVLFATFITLVLVPALYLIAEDLVRAWRLLYGRSHTEDSAPAVRRVV